MASINSVAQRYGSLCLAGIADALEQLLSQAEAHESSYLQFAESLVLHEQQQRNGKRIEQNRKRAGFPLHKSLEEFDYRFQTTISKRDDCMDAGGRATQEQLPRSTACSTSALSTTATTSSSSARPASARPIWPSASV
uniref:ATP-binding protein n=1 Tax=Methylosarcina fibrata TaxID=105972 RepID=UPI00039EDCC5|nr:ATP-binding protein [Methylosarcina fibrata]